MENTARHQVSERYRRYSRNKFKSWKDRVSQHLPNIVVKFYSYPNYIDYSKHMLLGGVISDINNPFFSLQDCYGKRLNDTERMTEEVILELRVNELFSFVQKLQ